MDKESVSRYLTGQARLLCLRVEPVVTSTNAILVEEAQQGAPGGRVIAAAQQTLGRGRMGRSFYSPKDSGLYLSLMLRPELATQDSLLLTTAAAFATARSIDALTGEKTQIKWVNDLYLHGKKVTGILTESRTRSSDPSRLEYAVIGIGVNVWTPPGGFPREIADKAGALFDTGEHRVIDTRSRLAAGILNEFMAIYPNLTRRTFMEEYRERSFLIGRKVRYVSATHEPLAGSTTITITGIGDNAQLLAVDEEGRSHAFSSGEISIVLD